MHTFMLYDVLYVMLECIHFYWNDVVLSGYNFPSSTKGVVSDADASRTSKLVKIMSFTYQAFIIEVSNGPWTAPVAS